MEKFKTQEIKVGGKSIIFYSWRFTRDQRADLKAALAKYPDEKVLPFIDDLEMICLLAKNFLNERNVTFQRAERKRMLGRFKKAEEDLYILIDKHQDSKKDVCLKEKRNIFDNSIFSEDAMILEKERLHYLLLAAAMQLKEIITIIKDESGEPGRPSTDVATGQLVKIIAHGFQNYFGEKPTGHISRPDLRTPSPFFPVIQVVLDACGLSSIDPSRHIRAALKTL